MATFVPGQLWRWPSLVKGQSPVGDKLLVAPDTDGWLVRTVELFLKSSGGYFELMGPFVFMVVEVSATGFATLKVATPYGIGWVHMSSVAAVATRVA